MAKETAKEVVIVVGGTSGLGLEIAKLFSAQGKRVVITGRTDPRVPELQFLMWDLTGGDTGTRNVQGLGEEIFTDVESIETLAYAAGFWQSAGVTELDFDDIEDMFHVGVMGAVFLIESILRRQGNLPGFIAITSTSAWKPRPNESLYCATKAALRMFTESMSLDGRIGKTLVAAPAGMHTPFWRNHPERERETFLDPKLVAQSILALWEKEFSFAHQPILRDPYRDEPDIVR